MADTALIIDKLQPEHVQPPAVTGGYLLQIDLPDFGETGMFSYDPTMVVYVDPQEREIKQPQRDPQEQYIRNYFGDFLSALNGTNWMDPQVGYAAYIDANSWIDWHILEVLSGNIDAMAKSSFFYKPRDGKIMFGPHWDFDLAFGSGGISSRSWGTGRLFAGWWGRLFRDPDFWQKWIDRYQELRRSSLSLSDMYRLIDRLAGEVRRAQPRDQQRWLPRLRGITFEQETVYMKNLLAYKVEFIDQQFVQPPAFSLEGGKVPAGFTLAITGPAHASVYFTLDGSDPRLPQGDLSPKAQTYREPIKLNKNVRLVARARNLDQRQTGGPPISSPWSGPQAATFEIIPADAGGTPPRLNLKIHPTGQRVLSFSGLPGRPYTIQFIEDLASDSWKTLDTEVGTPDGATVVIVDCSTNRTRFYRLTTPWTTRSTDTKGGANGVYKLTIGGVTEQCGTEREFSQLAVNRTRFCRKHRELGQLALRSALPPKA